MYIRPWNGGSFLIINIHILYLAPVAPPKNVNATSYTPTSITVCFEYPEGSTQNGLIASFNVTLVGSPIDTDSQTVSIPVTSTNYPLTGSMCGDVTNLQEFNEYNITAIVLENSAGMGPSSAPMEVQTLETGKYMSQKRQRLDKLVNFFSH